MAEKESTAGAMSGKPLIREYHDREWGTPLHDDRKLFEFLILEGMQAGLSWNLVLNKRENFRAPCATSTRREWQFLRAPDIQRLLGDAGVIRNRLGVLGAISSANASSRSSASSEPSSDPSESVDQGETAGCRG